jgi:tetratricopeptide (TPR) repeat protein
VTYHAEVSLDRLGGANSAAMVRAILGKSFARSVALAGLSADDTRALARQLLGTEAVPKELDRVIETYTDGNPLFIEELVRDLVEAGRLVRGPDGYRFIDAPGSPAIPTTVEGVVLARVDRLQPESRRLLQVASVLGRVFPHRVLEAMTDLDGNLDRLLLQLQDLDFLYQSAVTPERLHSFKHVLTQEAIYQTLVRGRREAYHNLAAQTIESLYGEGADDWVEVLAHHYTRSGNDEKALVYLDLAHRKADRTFAVAQAKEFFDEAMKILDRAPETPVNDRRRITFLTNQFLTAMFLGNTEECFNIAVRYEAMADGLDDLALRGRFSERLGQAHEILGRVDEAVEKLTAAVAFLTEAGDVAGVGIAHTTFQWTHMWVGNYDKVLAHGAEALRAFEHEFEPLYAMWARSVSAYAHAQRGAWKAAIADAERALRIGEENANDSQIAFAAIMLCITYTGQGQLDKALEYGELGRQKAPTPAEALWIVVALGQTWCRAGRAEEAAQTLASLVPVCEASGFLFVQLMNATNLGEAYWRAGRLEQARHTLDTVVGLAGERRFRYLHGSALRLLGEVTRTGTHFDNSFAVLSEIGAENELALAHAGYGRLCLERHQTEEARRHLTEAMDTFERLGTIVDPELIKLART